MSYPSGQPVRLTFHTFSDPAETTPADPDTVDLSIEGTTGTHTWPGGDIVRESAGVFHYDALEQPGHWPFHWTATGAVATSLDGSFDVDPAYGEPAVPTTPPSYATTGDLANWLGHGGPANAVSLLRSASILVAAAANRDPYTDVPDTIAARVLRDATTAQAAAWIALGIDPARLGLDVAPVKSRKIGSGDISYDTTGQDAARQAAATQLAPEARQVLYTGGLLALLEPVGADPSDGLPSYGLSAAPPLNWPLSWWHNL